MKVYKPWDYQLHSEQHIIDHPAAGLFMEMGLGKTVVALTALDRLIYEDFEVEKVLVIAPLRVAQETWSAEIVTWEHLKHLKLSKVLGTQTERKRALLTKADIYIVNRENVPWLVSYLQGNWFFDMIIIDELSSFKSPKSTRFKALKSVRPKSKRIVGLTGTPAPNGLIDLWSQLYLLDMGERLGRSITNYRETYFHAGAAQGHVVYKYKLNKGAKEEIFGRIEDICISMKSEDYLDLPKRLDIDVEVKLSDEHMKDYFDFEKKMVMEIYGGEKQITVANAAALRTKLLQFAGGAIYGNTESQLKRRSVHDIHEDKLEALSELIEAANGEPVLVFYSFQSDVDRIVNYLKIPVRLFKDTNKDVKDWNDGKIQVLLTHAASAGHGLNLQYGGHICIWYGLQDSLELYQQGVKRVDRQGQTQVVKNYRLIAKGTMDEAVAKNLEGKAGEQDGLMEAVKAVVQKYMPDFD